MRGTDMQQLLPKSLYAKIDRPQVVPEDLLQDLLGNDWVGKMILRLPDTAKSLDCTAVKLFRAAQIRAAQDRAVQIRAGQVRAAQARAAQVHTA
jgi:hypothetical protein